MDVQKNQVNLVLHYRLEVAKLAAVLAAGSMWERDNRGLGPVGFDPSLCVEGAKTLLTAAGIEAPEEPGGEK